MVEKVGTVAPVQKPVAEINPIDVGEKNSKLWLWILIAVVVIAVIGIAWWLI